MFKFLTDSVENAIDVATGTGRVLIGEEGPSKRQVAKLIADGLTIVAVADLYNVSTDVIESLIED